jgi:hypothetical protein
MSDNPGANEPMQNRRHTRKLILVVAFVLLFLILPAVVGIFPVFILFLGTPFVLAYMAYLGLRIRKGFVVQTYRNQALGIATIAAYLAAIAVVSPFTPSSYVGAGYGPILFGALKNLVGCVPFLLWIDSTEKVSRKSDPYERDSLHWSKVRYVVFSVVIASAVLSLLFAPVVLAFFGSYVPTVSLFANVVGNLPFFVTVLAGVTVLPLGAIRSRDTTLRRHILWLAAFFAAVVALLIESVASSILFPGSTGPNSAYGLAFIVGIFYIFSYCLYKSARSLAPHTSRLEGDVAGAK